MQMYISSSQAKKQLKKTTSAKKILKGITSTFRVCTMLLYPVRLCIVPSTQHARRDTMLKNYEAPEPNQTYSTYHSGRVGSEEDWMYEELCRREARSNALSVNENNNTNVRYSRHESKHRNFDDHVDDSIFEDFIRRNRERFMLEKEETASISMRRMRSSRHYVMDDWLFEDFIRRNRKRFQLEKEEIISIDDYSDDELDGSVALEGLEEDNSVDGLNYYM